MIQSLRTREEWEEQPLIINEEKKIVALIRQRSIFGCEPVCNLQAMVRPV